MKQRLLLTLFALFSATISWADVEINEENFPDEIFRNWVLSQDYGTDGVLTNVEIAGVKDISVQTMALSILPDWNICFVSRTS